MTDIQIALIKSSWNDMSKQGDALATRFYHHLFTIAPEVRSLFKDDISEQKRKLRVAIGTVVRSLGRFEDVEKILSDMGKRHSRYGAQDEHYAVVGQALITALQELHGPEKWNSDLQDAWVEAYTAIATTMKNGAKAAMQQVSQNQDSIDKPMTDIQIALVKSSWSKMNKKGDLLTTRFYYHLFTLAPEVRSLFKGDISEQKRKLHIAIGTVVRSLGRFEDVEKILSDMGKRHSGYGAQDKHYAVVGRALITALQESHDPEDWTSDLKNAWIKAYTAIAKTMKNGSKEGTQQPSSVSQEAPQSYSHANQSSVNMKNTLYVTEQEQAQMHHTIHEPQPQKKRGFWQRLFNKS